MTVRTTTGPGVSFFYAHNCQALASNDYHLFIYYESQQKHGNNHCNQEQTHIATSQVTLVRNSLLL